MFKSMGSPIAIAASLVLTACGGDGSDNETPSSYQLQVLHFSDIDGGRDIIGNAPRFSAMLDKFRGEYSNSVVVSSGDNWIPGPEYSVAGDEALEPVLGTAGVGRAQVAFLNALGVQASVFGNHEFDLGTGAVAALLTAVDDYVGTQFPYLSTNIDFSTDANLSPLVSVDGAEYNTLNNAIVGYTTITINGEAIGVVGATTPSLDNISAPGDVTLMPEDAADTAALAAVIQASVDQLTANGVDKIIVLSHMQQIAIEKALASLLTEVDVIVAGGSNTILADSNDRLRDGDVAADTYPLLLNSATSDPVLVVNVDGDFNYLGRLVVDFDRDGKIITSRLDDSINGAWAADEQGLVDSNLTADDAIAGVQAVSTALGDALSERAGNTFGFTNVYLNGERLSVRTEETNLGNLTADANLSYAQSIDASAAISIKNGGGIRGAIGSCVLPAGSNDPNDLLCSAPTGTEGINLPGQISQLDVELALRFNNALTLVSLTGQQLKDVLEHAVSGVADGATPGSFAQVGGMRFSYDPTLSARTEVDNGQRIRNLVVEDDNGATAGGSPVVVVQEGVLDVAAASQVFRVVTLAFLQIGGDGYPFPADTDVAADVVKLEQKDVQTGTLVFADDGTEQDAVAEFLNTHFPDDGSMPFNDADKAAADDERIQNLSQRSDTVLSP
jgi:5'-nucleotidase / UDP-sugar diphosphatase